MLAAYEASTLQLFQAATSPDALIPTADLDAYINQARNQVAAEAECLSTFGVLTIDPTTQQYPFSAIVITNAGFGPVMNVGQGNFNIGNGTKLVYPRAWPWFQLYTLNRPVPFAGQPREFAQQGQGVAGTLWFNLADIQYTINLDVICLPIPLIDDTTVEAIPLLWQIPVPFYAAWLAMMNAQRQADADMMLERYHQLMTMARAGATPQTLRHIWSQGPDVADANRYGISGRGGGGG